MTYNLYTDGSCRNNGKSDASGAWYFILLDENNNQIWEYGEKFNNATNQRAELLALINGCECLLKTVKGEFFECNVFSDSAYCIRCKKENWYSKWQSNNWINSQKKPVANKELWERLIPFFEDIRFNFNWVKGHDKNELNNYVDEKAQFLSL